MLKLFRNIRTKLVSENSSVIRNTNYFKYAIGEIFLVVIGILIALQINNWNEGKKDKKFEKEILFLIDKNIEQDSILLTIELFKSKRAIKLTNSLLEQVALREYNDSLNYWMGKIISFERFKSKSSAFEVLKAKGIETLSDKELQLELISYYDESLFKVYESLNDVEGSFNADWIPILKQDFSDFKFMDICIPVNSKEFFDKPSTIVLFKLYKDNREGTVKNIENALLKISEVRNLTKESLK